MMLPTLLFALAASQANGTDPLNAAVAAAQRSGSPTWLSWSVPSAAEGEACCWNSRDSRHERSCSLTGDNHGMNMSREDGGPVDATLIIYARVDRSGVDALRAYSSTCRVDRGAERIQEVANVTPSHSVAWLETLARGGDAGRASKRRSDGAVSAIALHDDQSADAALERIAKTGDAKQIRHAAAFWLGNTRGQAGYEALVRLREVADASFREHLTFALSQSTAAKAPATLIDMARNDASAKVRGQALFWIAQKAQKRSDADVIRAATEDPDVDVKKKAVFALSQIPGGEGVPDLIRVAQENKSREVRKQAMFWLGQSKDPRALAFFEKILTQ
jgi:hypothetical protein